VGILSLLRVGRPPETAHVTNRAQGPDEASFSPTDDLEDADLGLIRSAHLTIDIAMYAFTDRRIEAALAEAARNGVKLRIYRDPAQFAEEEKRASESGTPSVTDQLLGQKGVEIRVKGGGASMHLKAFCVDGATLRTGSANWSFSGETRQDNDLYVLREPSILRSFQRDFSDLWSRADNRALTQ